MMIPREARLINQSGRRPERSESRANSSEKYIYIHVYIDEGVRPVAWQQCKHSCETGRGNLQRQFAVAIVAMQLVKSGQDW